MLDSAIAHILEAQILRVIRPRIAHGTDQACPSLAGKREDRQKVGFIQVNVQLTVECRAARLNVGHIEDLPVGAAGKPRPECLANQRARPVTTGEIGRLANLLASLGAAKMCHHTIGFLVVRDELRTALHRYAQLL